MPSKITDIYSYLIDAVEAIWTDASHIPNFLDVGSAPSTTLQNGFSIGIGPATSTPGDLASQELFTRTIFIARTLLQSPHNTDQTEVDTDVLKLLEDHYLLRKELRIDNTLGENAADIGYDGDGGIENLVIESGEGMGKYYVFTTTFTLKYLEDMIAV